MVHTNPETNSIKSLDNWKSKLIFKSKKRTVEWMDTTNQSNLLNINLTNTIINYENKCIQLKQDNQILLDELKSLKSENTKKSSDYIELAHYTALLGTICVCMGVKLFKWL
eukprot:NODE_595_length_5602_cov_0.719062.p6 type:complete len:111 gc:universal NODE_595_length_5602_cov_0.719062:5259-5591(+)